MKARLAEGFGGLEPEALRTLLGHADSRLRGGAQRELARRDAWQVFSDTLTDGRAPQLARIHAVWGLGQGLRRKVWRDDGILVSAMADGDPGIRVQTAKIIAEAAATPVLSGLLRDQLKDSSPRVRLQAALSIGRQRTPESVAALTELAAGLGREDSLLRHGVVTGLTGTASGKEMAALAGHPSPEARLAAGLALGRQGDPDIAVFLEDNDPEIVAEAAWAIHDDEGIPAALPALAAWLDRAPESSAERAVRRALNANYRLGTPEAAARLARYALRSPDRFPVHHAGGKRKEPQPLPSVREEALILLTLWRQPPALDRMDARPRPGPARDLSTVRPALQAFQPELLNPGSPALKPLCLQVMATFNLDVPATITAAAALDGDTPPDVRLQSLRLLARQHPDAPDRRPVLEKLLSDKEQADLRIEALSQLLSLDPAAGLAAADRLISGGRLVEQQAAVARLAGVRLPEADARLAVLLTDSGDAGAVPPGIRLDVLEAAAARAADAPALAAGLAARDKFLAASSDPMAALTDCLTGGDHAAGRTVALENLAANCVACHRFQKGAGSAVGPALESIGRAHPAPYLLEALAAPSAVIAPGFGMTTVTLKNGTTLVGTVLRESPDKIILRQPDGVEISVAAAEVETRTPPISVMPPMHGILTPRQIRDVVAYLATLRAEPDKATDSKEH